MTTAETIQTNAQQYLTNNYGVRSLALVRGEGAYVWDSKGRRYLDLLSGLGVNNLGHCHPKVTAAIREQAGKLLHVSNLYLIEPQVELARLLVKHSPADKVFFCNSGTEAIEAAIKMARRYSFDKYGEGRHRIIALKNSFHGRTLGALSATGQTKYHHGFQPLVEGFIHVPINDIEAMRSAVNKSVCAVLIEPVQGEGGVYPCDEEYLKQVRQLCDENNLLLIFDEVQCGLGRAGHLFASEELGFEPDLISLAKSLAGGVPIGALLAKDEPAQAFVPGTHAATFGGNPLAAAAGVAAFNVLLDEKLPQRSKRLGQEFRNRLNELKKKHSCILEVRSKGLMIGVQMNFPVAELLLKLLERGYIAGPAGPEVLRFLPPLIIEENLLFEAIAALDELLP
ncbi:MAG: aspartate aminotransferase family protein [Candidatus Omnitrophota bacterium]